MNKECFIPNQCHFSDESLSKKISVNKATDLPPNHTTPLSCLLKCTWI